MTDSPVQNPSALSQSSLGMQVLLSVVTLGFYSLYWWYSASTELQAALDADYDPALRTIGLFVPLYNLVALWRFSHDAAAVTDQDGPVLFLLFIVLPPAGWFLVQSGINQKAAAA